MLPISLPPAASRTDLKKSPAVFGNNSLYGFPEIATRSADFVCRILTAFSRLSTFETRAASLAFWASSPFILASCSAIYGSEAIRLSSE
jgi:hypothetical protein